MNRHVRAGLGIAAMIAAGVAAKPYAEFLIAPPDDKAGRWVATVIALCVFAAASLALRGARPSRREE